MNEEQFNVLCKWFEINNQTMINIAKDMERNITLLNIKIDESVAKLDAKIDDLAQRVDKLENRMDKLEQRMDKLENRIDKLEKEQIKIN